MGTTTKKAEMRRSCSLCRSRKIACSGERICTACRERSIECVYDLEASKGRPTRKTPRAGSAEAPKTSGPASPEEKTADVSHSMAVELDLMFRENFGADLVTIREGSATGPVCNISYRDFLEVLTQDLIEIIATKFSCLGCQPFFGAGERFYRACLTQDTTSNMFDPPAATAGLTPEPPAGDVDLLADYSSRLITQLIEIWFSTHPLSIVLSKTLLLRDLRSQTTDSTLLAVLLADAYDLAGDADGAVRGPRLLNWAIGQLQGVLMGQEDLTTAQTTLLIGWHLACKGHVRRAMCYVCYTSRVITRLKQQLQETPMTGQTHVNGIDRGAVETEMIQNIWWVTQALTVWSFIQIDMPFANHLPTHLTELMQDFPPVNEADSMLLQLDRATCNLSTLRPQAASLESVWLLSHATGLAAYLYALYPHTIDSPPSARPWQDRLLLRLDRLISRDRSLVLLCADAREAVLDIVVVVQAEAPNRTVCAWLLTVYHTIFIHLLFPCIESNGQSAMLTYQMIDELRIAMEGLITTFARVQSSFALGPRRSSAASALLHSYILGLDAAGRALSQILVSLEHGTLVEPQCLLDRLPQFAEWASTLCQLFSQDVLLQDRRWRLVKDQLKAVGKAFRNRSPASGDRITLLSSSSTPRSESLSNNLGGSLFSSTTSLSSMSQKPSGRTNWPQISQQSSFPDPTDLPAQILAHLHHSNIASLDDLPVVDESVNGNQVVQHPIPLTSLWTQLQATELDIFSRLPGAMMPSVGDLSLTDCTSCGKRPVEDFSFSSSPLIYPRMEDLADDTKTGSRGYPVKRLKVPSPPMAS